MVLEGHCVSLWEEVSEKLFVPERVPTAFSVLEQVPTAQSELGCSLTCLFWASPHSYIHPHPPLVPSSLLDALVLSSFLAFFTPLVLPGLDNSLVQSSSLDLTSLVPSGMDCSLALTPHLLLGLHGLPWLSLVFWLHRHNHCLLAWPQPRISDHLAPTRPSEPLWSLGSTLALWSFRLH